MRLNKYQADEQFMVRLGQYLAQTTHIIYNLKKITYTSININIIQQLPLLKLDQTGIISGCQKNLNDLKTIERILKNSITSIKPITQEQQYNGSQVEEEIFSQNCSIGKKDNHKDIMHNFTPKNQKSFQQSLTDQKASERYSKTNVTLKIMQEKVQNPSQISNLQQQNKQLKLEIQKLQGGLAKHRGISMEGKRKSVPLLNLPTTSEPQIKENGWMRQLQIQTPKESKSYFLKCMVQGNLKSFNNRNKKNLQLISDIKECLK